MKTISFVIPVYNEEERLAKTLIALKGLSLPRGLKLETVIFVNDGSTDSTLKILNNFKKQLEKRLKSEVKIISYKVNKGKGYAISVGMCKSSSDYSLFFDADMSTKISEIKKFLPFIRKNIPIIIGTRKNSHSTVIRHQPFLREMLGRGFTLLSNIVLNTWVTDFTCGFKAFSTDAKDVLFPKLKINSWGFDAELLFLGRIKGFEFVEVPVIWSDDRRSKVKIWKDLPKSLIDLFSIRLNHTIPKPAFSFVKVLKNYLF
ncbi:hypothetical protein A2W14_01585 [Candidatus Gottesmanbacteria bacterium RBG_16_37_8]|uniref:Glycosyltransferase 2-like domain-containing protein n=1 Tax=Candidatus Gottesmanbacteria bacterium RBG_16_37_8 TaxID=1798371 RepID=A0A1F5YQR7_9BACT|nr:MAG: hypothetical protein A2W14_01585 [Candidatus Gottesmanbacteria bacterium RBG_16_37_8]